MRDRWLVCCLLALLCLTPGCDKKQAGPANGKAQAGDLLKLVARIDRSSCIVGEELTIEVQLSNLGSNDQSVTQLRLDFRSVDLQVSFKGKTSEIQRFYPNFSNPIAPREVMLKSHDQLTLRIPFPAIQAGTYKIQAHFHGQPHSLETEPLELIVEPKMVDGELKDRMMAVIETELGVIELKLLTADSFSTVYNFVRRANEGKFDGVLFDKLPKWPNALVQAGGRPGDTSQRYSIPTQTGGPDPARKMVAMGEPVLPPKNAQDRRIPRAEDASSGGSHFFFYVRKPVGPAPINTVFAEVISGMWVIEQIHRLPSRGGPQADVPQRKIRIKKVTIKLW